MPTKTSLSPEVLPVLSRGKHRNARRGACFMEYASFLAGERWSDHPSCTHPAVASLARLVNDWTSGAERSKLTVFIPSVIGLNGDDDRVALLVATLAATASLPIASESRQRMLALGLIRCASLLAELDPALFQRIVGLASAALDGVPLAKKWARENSFAYPQRQRSTQPMCEAIISVSVAGIGEACVVDADERLRSLLAVTISETSRLLIPEAADLRRTLTSPLPTSPSRG